MQLPSKLVGIEGGSFSAVVKGIREIGTPISLEKNEYLTLQHVSYPHGKAVLSFQAQKCGRGLAVLRIEGQEYTVPFAIFRDREFFVCLTISSNYHLGFDPEEYVIGVQPDGRVPEGHAFEKVCRRLVEPHVHALGLPVTWLIDEAVAEAGSERIHQWHTQYYDDYGVMPPSYIHYNALNYNRSMDETELTAYLQDQIRRVEQYFPYGTDVIGIDQYIGSVDNLFARACENLGIHSLWGMGYDHFECDTSMYHRGCPWDCYKPDGDNCRIPARYPTDLWMYQWTQRDILHTFKTPTGPSGSVIFSTDADDIRVTNILASQKDYYNRLLADYYASYERYQENGFGVFLMHQEDHDTGFEDNNLYWGHFLRNIQEPVTYATMPEITAWLNLKFHRSEQPSQTMLAHDVLTCQGQVVWGSMGVAKPDDWGVYPPHIFHYDRDIQIVAQAGQRLPARVYDYQAQVPLQLGQYYPERQLPQMNLLEECITHGEYRAKIVSDQAAEDVPLILELTDPQGRPICRVIRVNLQAGENQVSSMIGEGYTL